MHWKPIPTRETLDGIFGDDALCRNLFLLLLWNAADTDKPWTDKRGKSIVLKRGQVVFGRNQYAKYLLLEATQSKMVERALDKLEKVYKQIAKQATHDWTLVTAINYDYFSPNSQANSQAIAKQQPSNSQAIATSIQETINKKQNIPPPPKGEETPYGETWDDFVEFRKQKKSALTPIGVSRLLKLLGKHPPATAIAMLEQSMAQGWTGVFPVNPKDTPAPRTLPDPPAGQFRLT